MKFFELELKKIVGDICPSATYVGRACYVRLTDTNRAKIQFVDCGIMGNYPALQVTILNENNGVIDSVYLYFKDILRCSQNNNFNAQSGGSHIWFYNNQSEWDSCLLTSADFSKLQKSLLDYLMVFGYSKI